MNREDMALKSLAVGVITFFFLLYVLFGVYIPAGGKLEPDSILAVFSGVVTIADIAGLVFGILGLRCPRLKLALAGLISCAVFMGPLLVINIYIFPSNVLGI
jgi:hypothetical protein